MLESPLAQDAEGYARSCEALASAWPAADAHRDLASRRTTDQVILLA